MVNLIIIIAKIVQGYIIYLLKLAIVVTGYIILLKLGQSFLCLCVDDFWHIQLEMLGTAKLSRMFITHS